MIKLPNKKIRPTPFYFRSEEGNLETSGEKKKERKKKRKKQARKKERKKERKKQARKKERKKERKKDRDRGTLIARNKMGVTIEPKKKHLKSFPVLFLS